MKFKLISIIGVFISVCSPPHVFAYGKVDSNPQQQNIDVCTNNPQAQVTPSHTNIQDSKTCETPILSPAITSPLYGDLTLKFMNQYITRGITVQSEGVTVQPILKANVHLYDSDGFINDLSLLSEFWNDISSNTKVSGPPTSAPYWTETYLRAGLSLGFAKYLTFSTVFTQFLTPSDGYREGRYINNVISFNDVGLFSRNFSLKPQFAFLYELPDSGQAGLQPHAWYFEPCLTPNYNLPSASGHPINLAVPIKLGLGKQFYNGTPYGFLAFGPQITVPLSAVPTSYGKWNLIAAYTYYNLGSTTASIADGKRNNQNLFTGAISITF